MLLGRDWHLGPFEALRQIDVIEGTLSPSAELLLRLYRRAGHTLEVHQADTEGVILRGQRSDTGERLGSLIHARRRRPGRAHNSQRQRNRDSPVWTGKPHALGALHVRPPLGPSVTRLVRRLAPDALDQIMNMPPVDTCEYCGAELTILGVNSEGWVAECANGHQVVLKDDEL